mgnify:CR=1 FL=1
MRDQWEYAHEGRFALQLVGFGTLLASVVFEPAGTTAQMVARLWAAARQLQHNWPLSLRWMLKKRQMALQVTHVYTLGMRD